MFNNGPRWSTSYKFINDSQHFSTRDRLKDTAGTWRCPLRMCWWTFTSTFINLLMLRCQWSCFSRQLKVNCTLHSFQYVLVLFSDMQLSIHTQDLHTKMYFTAFQSWFTAGVDNVREKIPFLWFVGNISVLKFCGCPAEIGAKISLFNSDN